MKVEALTLLGVLSSAGATSQPRSVFIKDQQFIQTSTNQPIVLKGPNVVVKGKQHVIYLVLCALEVASQHFS